ncbi:MAG: hypothetical protein JRN52_04960 [Nitrososphaerota archaeon]|nr:hypothetical protein [Nitrososphaerota archaeon]
MSKAEVSRLVVCPKCNSHVNSILLRSNSPKCDSGHELGTWLVCSNSEESHVYLSLEAGSCPYCGSKPKEKMSEGRRVKCLYRTLEGAMCSARSFVWIKEGPPCFMNHVSKMRLET